MTQSNEPPNSMEFFQPSENSHIRALSSETRADILGVWQENQQLLVLSTPLYIEGKKIAFRPTVYYENILVGTASEKETHPLPIQLGLATGTKSLPSDFFLIPDTMPYVPINTTAFEKAIHNELESQQIAIFTNAGILFFPFAQIIGRITYGPGLKEVLPFHFNPIRTESNRFQLLATDTDVMNSLDMFPKDLPDEGKALIAMIFTEYTNLIKGNNRAYKLYKPSDLKEEILRQLKKDSFPELEVSNLKRIIHEHMTRVNALQILFDSIRRGDPLDKSTYLFIHSGGYKTQTPNYEKTHKFAKDRIKSMLQIFKSQIRI